MEIDWVRDLVSCLLKLYVKGWVKDLMRGIILVWGKGEAQRELTVPLYANVI